MEDKIELSLEEIKKIELDILKDIHRVCEKNGLRYYLAGGTLLGAIRHKGFIPWDDDIDILMPRPDYMKFIKIYENEGDKKYKLTSPYNNKNHLYTFTKVFDTRTIKIENGLNYDSENIGGIEVDVFPTDGLPDNIDKSNKYFRKQKLLFHLYSFSVTKKSVNKNIIKRIIKNTIVYICRLIGKQRFIKVINNNAMKYEFDKSNYIGLSVTTYYGSKERIEKKHYIEQIKVEFEGYLFNAPKNYDQYLSNLYGDYMKLPPEDKRVTHHEYEAYWK